MSPQNLLVVATALALQASLIPIIPSAWSQPCGPYFVFESEDIADRFGAAVADIGDVDGDGVTDLAVGAPLSDSNGVNAGRVYTYSGRTGTQLYVIDGRAAGDLFGRALAPSGDVNGDTVPDLLVGAPHNDSNGTDAGAVYLVSGREGSTINVFLGESGDLFGWAVASLGLVDSDSIPDIVVGAPGNSAAGDGAGGVSVLSGVTGARIHFFTGNQAGDSLGYSVACAGMIDQDSIPDIIAGAPVSDSLMSNSGRAYVYSGMTGMTLYSFQGGVENAFFGYSVSGAGDIDHDGREDFIIGAPGVGSQGAAYAVSGATGQSLHIIDQFPYTAGVMDAGREVWGGDDFDGDSTPDLLVAGPQRFGLNDNGGAVFLISGATGAVVAVIFGGSFPDELGWSTCAVRDIDADGNPEIFTGVPVPSDAVVWSLGIGPDTDGDGLADCFDYCWLDAANDMDADGYCANRDNCPSIYNPDQLDTDGDGIGDACEFCACPCFADPWCDSVINVLDVVAAVYVAFRGEPPTVEECPYALTDVTCDDLTNVLDVVRLINVAFRGGDQSTEFCDPCAP